MEGIEKVCLTDGCAESEKENANRFKGFANIYDLSRPSLPIEAVKIICSYSDGGASLAVDLGSGTGLSTVSLSKIFNTVIGIEPSEDMLKVARKKECDSVRFIKAFSDNTTLQDNIADAVVCSQSFHWMNPEKTLKEVNRILKNKGVFATVDNDWPPVCNKYAESEYIKLFAIVRDIEVNNRNTNSTFIRRNKEKHLDAIKNSGYFSFAREIVFSEPFSCNAERFINLAMGQGSLQTVLKNTPELIIDYLEDFKKNIVEIFKDQSFESFFCYRMRIGIK